MKKEKKKNRWELWITRETALFERVLRMLGYKNMLGGLSKLKVSNLLAVNNDSLTSLYVYLPEVEKNRRILLQEYESEHWKKLIPHWNKIISDLKSAGKLVLYSKDSETFKEFVKKYQSSRSIVFYTYGLIKILEAKKESKHIKILGKIHENAERQSSKVWDSLKPFFRSVALKNKLPIDNLMYYFPEEFFQLLKSGNQIKSSEVRKRKKYYVLLLKDGRLNFYLGKTAKRIETIELPTKTTVESIKILRGQVASKGIVKGRVKIVNKKDDIHAMSKNDILVSIMTTPRLMPAVMKAKAIVTEEGGLTSHAAVVSREMKIPCIVGTKIATKVFKDGDLVEVDANKGFVRKLR